MFRTRTSDTRCSPSESISGEHVCLRVLRRCCYIVRIHYDHCREYRCTHKRRSHRAPRQALKSFLCPSIDAISSAINSARDSSRERSNKNRPRLYGDAVFPSKIYNAYNPPRVRCDRAACV